MRWKFLLQCFGKRVALGLLLVCSTACSAENQNTTAPQNYHVVSLKPVQIDVAQLGLTNCTSILALSNGRALAACRSSKMDNHNDYGLRVYVLATDEKSPRILSVSRGLGDAYAVMLQKRSNAEALYKDLILADASAEFAYGTAIYQLQGDNLKYLGEIGYVMMSEDNNPISALNVTTIQATKDGFKVTFSHDVFLLNKDGEYQRHDARKLFMAFDGKSIH